MLEYSNAIYVVGNGILNERILRMKEIDTIAFKINLNLPVTH